MKPCDPDALSDGKLGDRGAERFNDANDLVTGDDRSAPDCEVALDDVEVGSTDATRMNSDEDFVGRGRGDRNVVET
jgi:hypothetical protein